MTFHVVSKNRALVAVYIAQQASLVSLVTNRDFFQAFKIKNCNRVLMLTLMCSTQYLQECTDVLLGSKNQITMLLKCSKSIILHDCIKLMDQ